MGRTKTKPFLKRKKVPKLYFHFWPPKKCPPFFFLIHTWWCENISASPCVSIHVHVVYFVTYFQYKLLFIVLDMGMIPERKNHKCFFVVRHPVLVKIIGTSNSHVRNIQKILKCLTVNKGNNKITELRTILQRESRSVNLTCSIEQILLHFIFDIKKVWG